MTFPCVFRFLSSEHKEKSSKIDIFSDWILKTRGLCNTYFEKHLFFETDELRVKLHWRDRIYTYLHKKVLWASTSLSQVWVLQSDLLWLLTYVCSLYICIRRNGKIQNIHFLWLHFTNFLSSLHCLYRLSAFWRKIKIDGFSALFRWTTASRS